MNIEDYKKTGVKNIICKSGRINYYRVCKEINGQGGSIQEETFDPNIGAKGGHKCCKSKVWWRHKVTCLRLGEGSLPPDTPPSDRDKA